ncbi:MAG: hypothetical protein QOI07_908 [Verrucomicrobiota bacterium]|jgi:hypothetical protein
MGNLMTKMFGASWKTTASMIGGTLMAALTWLSTLSYDQGQLALIIPIDWKPFVSKAAGIATLILFAYNGIRQKDKSVTGGWKQQDLTGATVHDADATLVQATANDSIPTEGHR